MCSLIFNITQSNVQVHSFYFVDNSYTVHMPILKTTHGRIISYKDRICTSANKQKQKKDNILNTQAMPVK